MKNQASFENTESLAKKLLEIFANLAGNAKSFDTMVEGIHDVCVVKNEKRLSAKGKEMREIVLRSLLDGREATIYVMKFRKEDWKTWSIIEVGQVLNISLKTSNGFNSVCLLYTSPSPRDS